ncbi:hypothetical protein HYR99_37545 [Candidatus Poribacteria bacterium]|nr:hypothetical protein [Candidatus Poribacteria bacterium]
MDNECMKLRKLNQDTFDAEAKKKIGEDNWDEFLKKVLADEFIIRRSNPAVPNQTKAEMLRWIEKHPAADRDPLEPLVWCDQNLGVVVCPVMMVRDGTPHKYQNIKVFKKQPQGNWQVVYWQVTEAPVE